MQKADTVLTNAVIYTADPSRPWAGAAAVRDGIILAVGSDAEIETYRAPDTEALDMGGRFILPAFFDVHMHPAQSAADRLYGVTLSDTKGKDNYIERISAFAESRPDLPVVEGRGFYRADFDRLGPRREWLDAIDDTRPILITSVDGHSMWVNTVALVMAGVTRDTPDPANGIIQRDASGEPAGLLQESAMDLMIPVKMRYTKEQYKQAVLWLQRYLHAKGIAWIYDAMVPIDNPDYYMAYQELAAEGKLTVHIRGAWHMRSDMEDPEAAINTAMEVSRGFTTPYFQVNAFKFFADQVVEEESAYLSEPYSHRSDGWHGALEWPTDTLKELFRKVDGAGFQVHAHAIGDGAVAAALDAIGYAVGTNGARDARHALAHLQCVQDRDKERMARLGVAAVVAPYWMVVDDYFWRFNVPYLGMVRAMDNYPYRSLVERGVHVAVHSDFAVTEPDYPVLFYTAVMRTLSRDVFEKYHGGKEIVRCTDADAPLDKEVYGPLPPVGERVSLAEAIRSATIEGAWALHAENAAGSIETGKAADFAVFERNFFEMDPEDFGDNPVVMTIASGRVVYDASIER